MAPPIVKVQVRPGAPPPGPVHAQQVARFAQDDWRNEGERAFKEVFGQEAWDTHSVRDYPAPAPGDSLGGRLGYWGLKTFMGLLLGLKAGLNGRRATHLPGIMARGKITVCSELPLPEHPFFVPGRSFPCRMRHANASFIADTTNVVRSCSLKFADTSWESPLDLPMNSGATAAFWDLSSFWGFVRARTGIDGAKGDWESQRRFLATSPAAFIGAIESLRLGLESYADAVYFSKVVLPWIGRDGVIRLCKFRVFRPDLEREGGLLPYHRQLCPWDQSPEPDDDRPNDYLRAEFRRRVEAGPVEYLLQVQVRDLDPEVDTAEVFNCNRLWNTEGLPWVDLAHVVLDELVADEEMEISRMWLGHQPEGMGIFEASNSRDYRSLAHTRVHVYPRSQAARLTRRRLRGPPAPFGEAKY